MPWMQWVMQEKSFWSLLVLKCVNSVIFHDFSMIQLLHFDLWLFFPISIQKMSKNTVKFLTYIFPPFLFQRPNKVTIRFANIIYRSYHTSLNFHSSHKVLSIFNKKKKQENFVPTQTPETKHTFLCTTSGFHLKKPCKCAWLKFFFVWKEIYRGFRA